MARDLGELGESTLRTWAAQVGAAANKATPDKTGWDFLLEIPLPLKAGGVPLDKLEYQRQVLVQVKATDSTSGRSTPIKLSNWKRLVDSPLPSFILLMQFDGADTCQRAYLVHIWKEEMAAVLKRLRELTGDVGPTELHKRTTGVNHAAEDRLETTDGRALIAAILNSIAAVGGDYGSAKNALRSELGYEEGRAEIKMKIVVPEEYRSDPDDLLVDFALGLLSHVEISEGEFSDLRFGIAVPDPDHRLEDGGRLEVRHEPAKVGTLVLTGVREIAVPAKLYVPRGIGEVLPRDRFKIRVDIPGGRLVLAPERNRLQFDFTFPGPEDSATLEHLHNLSSVALFLGEHSQLEQPDSAIRLTLEDVRLGLVYASELTMPQEVGDWGQLIQKFVSTARSLGCSEAEAVMLQEILRQKQVVEMAQRVVAGDPRDIILTFSLEEKPEEDRFCMPQHLTLFVGAHKVLLTYALLGPLHESEEGLGYRSAIDGIVRYRTIRMLREEAPSESVTELMEEISSVYEDDHAVLAWWRDTAPADG